MITIYHLGVSQSDRIVWLMEELKLPYELVWFDRGPDGLMPPEYRALHPAATAPVIRDGDLVLTESAVIGEYISHKYGDGRLSVSPDAPNYTDYLYWMYFNNNLQSMFFATLAAGDEPTERAKKFIDQRAGAYWNYLESRLGESEYLAGPEFTLADIMVTFNLTSLPLFGGRSVEGMPNASSYVERITARPAYVKAQELAGPSASRPES